jgi:hypothetical protein
MTKPPPVPILVASLLALGALGACSASLEIGGGTDLSELEAKMVEEQEKKTPDIEVGEATCPDDVDLEVGARFECTLTVGGVDAPYEVTMEGDDRDADVGSFHFEPAQPILDMQLVEDFVASQLNRRSQGATVECGSERVVVAEVGDALECTVSKGNRSTTVQAYVKDKEGTVSLEP